MGEMGKVKGRVVGALEPTVASMIIFLAYPERRRYE
jgi:hypothetical protein